MKARKHTKELLSPVVESSISFSEVLRKLGLKNNGGNFRLIQLRIKEYGISTEHFTGQSWAKGKQIFQKRTPDDVVFCKNSSFKSGGLFKRLMEKGFENCCAVCRLTSWLDKPITLHVDHINGDSSDNRIENLRILCPNCHQQTETWGNKKPVKLKSKISKTPKKSNKKTYYCSCGKSINYRSQKCKQCENERRFLNIDKKRFSPTKEELYKEIREDKTPFTRLGEKYGVSDNAVRKRAKKFGII